MNPILTLAPWEIVSGLTQAPLQAPADAVVSARWRGHHRDLLARAVEIESNVWVCFFRPADDDHVGNWVTKGNFYKHHKSATLVGSLDIHLSKILRTSTGEGRCGRLVALDTEGQTESQFRWAFLSPTIQRWRVRNPNGQAAFDLSALQTASFFNLSAETMRRELLQSLETPDSDASFALRFAALSPEQQHDLVLQFARGNKQELQQVMRWILTLYSFRLSDPSPLLWRFHAQIPHLFLSYYRHGQYISTDGRYSWLNQWETVLRAVFDFKINPQLLQNHRSVQELAEEQTSAFHAEIEDVSAHETLEAACQLSEWITKIEKQGLKSSIIAELRALSEMA